MITRVGIRRSRRFVSIGLGLLACVLLVLAGQMIRVRSATGDWRLTSAAAPSKFRFDGRDYRLASAERSVPDGDVMIGHTAGGGLIYGPPGSRSNVSTVLDVRTHRELFGYALQGGP
jgi:hypothetical protein